MAPAVKVTASSRIHMGLLDCGNGTPMMFGDAGFAPEDRANQAIAEESLSSDWELETTDAAAQNLSPRSVNELWELFDRAGRIGAHPCRLTVLSKTDEHCGRGSKTGFLMVSALAIMQRSFGSPEVAVDREMVTRLTGRGGTSSVGINTFWDGGVVFGSGHAMPRGERNFLPSSRRRPARLPGVNRRLYLGPQYSVGLFYDPNSTPVEGTQEVDLFQNHMPFPDGEIHRAIAAAYHGVLPALEMGRLDILADALCELNRVSLKAKEVELQTDATRAWLDDCWRKRLPVGLSSIGSTVYCFNEERSPNAPLPRAAQIAAKYGLRSMCDVGFGFDNHGARVQYLASKASLVRLYETWGVPKSEYAQRYADYRLAA